MEETKLMEILKAEVGPVVKEYVDEAIAKAAEARAPQVVERYIAQPNEAQAKAQRVLDAGAFIRAVAAADGRNDKVPEILAQWGRKDLSGQVEKALASDSLSAGGALVPRNLSSEVIEYLHAGSAVLSLNPRRVPLPGGNISFADMTGSATAYYKAENAEITKSEETFGEVRLEAKELAALVPVSNKLIRHASAQADQLVMEDVKMVMGARQDLALITGSGVSGEPRGLDTLVKSGNAFDITHAGSAATAAEIVADLGRALLKLANGNVQVGRGGWIFAPRVKMALWLLRDSGYYVFKDQMDNGMLLGHPFAESSQVSITRDDSGGGTGDESRVYFADFSRLLYGEDGGLEVEVSREASYNVSGTQYNAFQRGQTLVKVTGFHDFAARHRGAEIAIIKAVDWA